MTTRAGAFDKVRHAIRYWLLRRLPTCQQIVPVLSESLERRLGLRERGVVKAHLLTCIWCVWYLDQIDALRGEARRCGEIGEPPAAHRLTEPARIRIRQHLSRERG